jgi:hypothetical protein
MIAVAVTCVDRDDTTVTITNPTTSSIIAAVTSTVPTREECNFAADRIAYVVPIEVEHNDALAVNAVKALICSGRNNSKSTKDSAIGNKIPVIATATESPNVC